MATNFFQRQSDARRSTVWLVGMFCLAVVLIVVSIVAITSVAISQYRTANASLAAEPYPWQIPALAGAAALLLIVGGTFFRVMGLRAGGGTSVAEGLGGKRIYPNTDDPVARRLLNVVEEMAIASGTPVPAVFYLEKEEGINAFAAGYSPSDAVLGITRGCAEKLTRDELQGVIAHEFSHVLNGDMRLSIRLIGILYGILLVGLIGQFMFRMAAFSGYGRSRRSSRSGNAGLALLLIALALVVLGFIGTFFGNLIKAAVSRQREYLADASAVQFTRNPGGIAGALKRIGAAATGSRLRTANAAEASHMYFAKGVWEGFSGLWATHPPLAKRIRAIDPQWDGEFPAADSSTAQIASELAAGFAGEAAVSTGATSDEDLVEAVHHARDRVGDPTPAHRQYAAALLASIPPRVLAAAREAYGARAVVFCLLLDQDAEVRKRQIEVLTQTATPDVVKLTHQLAPEVRELDVRARLPLVDVALPALRAMSPDQYQRFKTCFVELVRADNKLELFEWVLSQVVMWRLGAQFEAVRPPRVDYYGLQRLAEPCSTLLSTLAYAGNDDQQARSGFAKASEHLPELRLQLRPRADCGLMPLREALTLLLRVSEKHRGRLVDACAASICADGHVNLQEAELLRGVADLLDCPLPPLLPGQRVSRDAA